ncbi:hypothetical protein BH24BAC1_BH24BAC1_34700 [soil metagenome]
MHVVAYTRVTGIKIEAMLWNRWVHMDRQRLTFTQFRIINHQVTYKVLKLGMNPVKLNKHTLLVYIMLAGVF